MSTIGEAPLVSSCPKSLLWEQMTLEVNRLQEIEDELDELGPPLHWCKWLDNCCVIPRGYEGDVAARSRLNSEMKMRRNHWNELYKRYCEAP